MTPQTNAASPASPGGTVVLALGHEPVAEATLAAPVAGTYHVLVTATAASGSYRLALVSSQDVAL